MVTCLLGRSVRFLRRSVVPGAGLVIVLMEPAAAVAKDVIVDCSKKTLAAALADEASPLVVEFYGTCAEDVLIARDDVTLRGIAPGGIIVGAPGVPALERCPGVWIDGGRRITLESFAIQDSDSRGIHLTRGAEAVIRSLTVDNNARGGVLMLGASRALIRDSTFDAGPGDGIGVWEGSSLTIGGTISADGHQRVGILVSDGSAVTQDFGGAQVTADGNGVAGVALQLGAEFAGSDVQANDNGFWGLFSYFESTYFGFLSATGNAYGVWLEAATLELQNSVIVDNISVDVFLDFGSIASFFGSNNVVGSVVCGDGVLTRGGASCPAPMAAAAASGTPSARAGGSRVGTRVAPRLSALRPDLPLTLEP